VSANRLALRFLEAQTPHEQAQAYADWYFSDNASWSRLQGMKYPVSRRRTESALQELLVQTADPSSPGHEEAVSFLREARAQVLAAPGRERAERAAARKAERYESQGAEIDMASPDPLRRLRRKKVWLYHGSSSKLLPEIRRHGIQPSKTHGRVSNIGRSAFERPADDRVFLTAKFGGDASATTYARAAARAHGGDPIVLRVLVDRDNLSYDSDDADLSVGHYQFEIDSVSPEEILEVHYV
jgi:hypothetical protein